MTDLKRTEREINGARDYAEAIIRTDPDPLAVLRADLKVDKDITERRRGEDLYRTLFNLGPVGIYSVDHSGVIQDFNSRAAEIWGRKPVPGDTDERFCGSFKIFRPDGTYVPHDQCPMAEVILGKISEVRDAEALIERPDGSRVTVLANIRSLKNDHGEVTGAINCFYDISGRKQAEQTLRESERRYRSLFESIDEGFCVIEVLFDSQQRAIDFVYVETNPAFEKQTGMHGAQGRRVLELAPALERHWFETYGRVARTGEPVRFQDRAEVLGRWFDVYAFRVEAPELRRVAVLFTDITQQREAREALRQSEERYRALFNLGPVAIYSIDRSGVIQDFNRRAAELWGREPAVGDTDQRFCGSFKMFRLDGSYMPHDQCPMAQVVSGKISEVRDAEVIIERSDGSRITALVNIRPLRNDRAEVTGAINCFYDITERLRIEDALRESKALVALKQAELQIQQQRDELTRLSRLAMLGEFSASLAHELNQPLSAIMCNVGAVRRQLSHDPPDLREVQKTLQDIVAADHRASEIIQGLRLLYRRGSVHMHSLDLNTLVRDLLKLLQHDIAKWGVDLSTELASELPAINGDPVQLQQVLLNLVTNACNAMADAEPKDRKLFVRTSASPEGVCVTVDDRGHGILPERLPHLFDPFYSTRPEGMGLGLTVCRAVINAHHGRLWTENNPEGGASFHFMLPAVEASDK